MDSQSIRNEIESIDSMPTIPTILKRLLSIIENPLVSLNEIGNFISNDPVLASRVLKMVNSPIYGFPGRISSINQALILLGLNVVKGMLLGISIFEVMQKIMKGLWEHSVGCAITARILAYKKGLKEPEEVTIAALLHDIGKVAFGLKFPQKYKEMIGLTEEKESFIFEIENAYFNVNHADAGSWIAQKWNFPKNLIEVIGYHHKPHLSRNFSLHTAIVHLSDIIIRAKGFGFAGDNFVPAVNDFAWNALNLSEYNLKEIIKELDDSLEEAEDFFFTDE